MNRDDDIRQRVQKWIDDFYPSVRAFSKAADMNHSLVYRYLKGGNIQLETFAKFEDAGMSVPYVITGKGSLFADNSTGYLLLKRHYGSDAIDNLEDKSRSELLDMILKLQNEKREIKRSIKSLLDIK